MSQMARFHSFLWPSNIPWFLCTTSSLSIHLLMFLGLMVNLSVSHGTWDWGVLGQLACWWAGPGADTKQPGRGFSYGTCQYQCPRDRWYSSVQLLSHVQLFATPWTARSMPGLPITNSWNPPKPMSIESVIPSNHLILYCPLLLLPSIFPSIKIFSNESALHIRWPKYWSFSFNISPSIEHPGVISSRMDWLDLLAVQGTLKNLL